MPSPCYLNGFEVDEIRRFSEGIGRVDQEASIDHQWDEWLILF